MKTPSHVRGKKKQSKKSIVRKKEIKEEEKEKSKEKQINIPSHILEAIGKGECTLFFGAGASRTTGSPTGEGLSDLITDRFLGYPGWKPKAGTSLARDWGLNLGMAVSLASAQGIERGNILTFVKTELSRTKPSPAHLKIPWFRWRAIVTTNYDRLIEDAYKELETNRAQDLKPVLSEEHLPEMGATGSDIIPLLKPHGSISQEESMSLSLEDIYQAKEKRRLLFTYIEVLHLLGPVIYIGYSFKDVHILDMIYDITSRLGPYRKPILFVTLQPDSDRADKERNWIQGPLKGTYLADGFGKFMSALSKQVTPAIVPSMIVSQMAPCRTMTFVSGGIVSDTTFYKIDEGEWEYWLTYSINHSEGYAGVIFERKGEADISKYGEVTFELNISKEKRTKETLEVKLESPNSLCILPLKIRGKRGKGWQQVTIPFRNKIAPGTRLSRVVLADSGERAILGREYKIGLRKINFV
jgi:hypothetical protein